MLLEVLVSLAALSGCIGGLLALVLYLKDRKLVRAGMGELHETMQVLRAVGEGAKDPAFLGQAISVALTHGTILPDGTPATLPNIIQGFIEKNGPQVLQWAEGYIPQLIALSSSSGLAREMAGKSAAARGVAALGSGLKGAQALQHGMKAAAGPLAWLGQLAEAVPALIQLKEAMGSLKGGSNSDGGGGIASSSGKTEWRPPV